ncbi:MAG: type II toxin-antitoxin system VapC family toxin [Clostridiales bacterium]|nr:type II toxin-antitoxin system VapC family toxin [Clostridiales bacterium]
MKIYLDNCCYNRPYDDQSQIRIHLETEAKLYIQSMVKNDKLQLVTSYILRYENDKNRFQHKRQAIGDFMDMYSSYYVGGEKNDEVAKIAEPIINTGIKKADAYHVACAILAGSDYFITTDDRLLKYNTNNIVILTPGEFIRIAEVDISG